MVKYFREIYLNLLVSKTADLYYNFKVIIKQMTKHSSYADGIRTTTVLLFYTDIISKLKNHWTDLHMIFLGGRLQAEPRRKVRPNVKPGGANWGRGGGMKRCKGLPLVYSPDSLCKKKKKTRFVRQNLFGNF